MEKYVKLFEEFINERASQLDVEPEGEMKNMFTTNWPTAKEWLEEYAEWYVGKYKNAKLKFPGGYEGWKTSDPGGWNFVEANVKALIDKKRQVSPAMIVTILNSYINGKSEEYETLMAHTKFALKENFRMKNYIRNFGEFLNEGKTYKKGDKSIKVGDIFRKVDWEGPADVEVVEVTDKDVTVERIFGHLTDRSPNRAGREITISHDEFLDMVGNRKANESLLEAKEEQRYKLKISRSGTFGNRYKDMYTEGTLAELIKYFSYTLETGKSYEREKGNKKIDLNPKTIEKLITNVENAKDNAAANGYGGYSLEVVDEIPESVVEEVTEAMKHFFTDDFEKEILKTFDPLIKHYGMDVIMATAVAGAYSRDTKHFPEWDLPALYINTWTCGKGRIPTVGYFFSKKVADEMSDLFNTQEIDTLTNDYKTVTESSPYPLILNWKKLQSLAKESKIKIDFAGLAEKAKDESKIIMKSI